MKLAIYLLLAAFLAAPASGSVLENLAAPRNYESCRVSSYCIHGGNGDGGQGNPVAMGETRTLADIECAGEVAHLWFTLSPFNIHTLRDVILRIYWDGEEHPSVESPIGAFFGLGHGKQYSFDSATISVGNDTGLNCFFPMPFNRRALVTLENQSNTRLDALYYYIDYKKFRKPNPDILYFHAQYRQARPELSRDNYIALEAEGSGHYAGMFYYIRSNSGGWWGEGDDMIYIDDDAQAGASKPKLHGTGMEDYFCAAWGMKHGQAFARFGSPLWELHMVSLGNENTAYRWHLEDAIAFSKSIRVTHEHGSNNDRNDDFFSVAYWYQTHPHAPFPPLPSRFERLPFSERKSALLESGQLDEYRALLTDVADRAVDTPVRTSAIEELAKSYLTNGDTETARNLVASYAWDIPVEDWAKELKDIAGRLALGDLALPSEELRVTRSDDGRVIPYQIGGSNCYKTESNSHSAFLYFKVSREDLRQGEKNLVLEADIHGPGALAVDYITAPEGGESKTERAIVKDKEAGWHTVQVPLKRARLNSTMTSGSDFRISNPDGDLYVRKITLREAGE